MSKKHKQIDKKKWLKEPSQHKWGLRIATAILTAIVSLPIFMLFHRLLPYPNWDFHFERILLFLSTYTLLFWLFLKIKYVLWIVIGGIVLFLSIGSLSHHYGFAEIVWDYKGLITNLANDEKQIRDIATQQTFPKRTEFLVATRFSPEIKTFANQCVQKHFKDEQKGKYRRYVQCFAIFKEINDNWQYVNDPAGQEYIASANESLKSMAGDCDDYTVLMAACLKAIGAKVRLVRVQGHIFPELFIESHADFDNLEYLIRYTLFKDAVGEKTLYFHENPATHHLWLNMDYTEPFPGGYYIYEDYDNSAITDTNTIPNPNRSSVNKIDSNILYTLEL